MIIKTEAKKKWWHSDNLMKKKQTRKKYKNEILSRNQKKKYQNNGKSIINVHNTSHMCVCVIIQCGENENEFQRKLISTEKKYI